MKQFRVSFIFTWAELGYFYRLKQLSDWLCSKLQVVSWIEIEIESFQKLLKSLSKRDFQLIQISKKM